jgi:hypothetical protein
MGEICSNHWLMRPGFKPGVMPTSLERQPMRGRDVLFAQFLLARGLKRAEHVGTISIRCELGPVSQKGAERVLKVLASKLVEQIRPGAEVK